MRERMMWYRGRLGVVAALVALLLVSAQAPAKHAESKAAAPARPKLVVLIVVDQMRADYVDRFGEKWHGGLRRLMDHGAWFTNAAFPYAKTVTCAGHATISTGDFPATTGMIENSWWDRGMQKMVTCTGDPRSSLILYGSNKAASAEAGDSAWRMEAPSFAEQLRAQSPGSRVVTLSLKARAAITLAGHQADSVTWLDGTQWATSTAFATAPRPELEKLATEHPISDDYGQVLFVKPGGNGTIRGTVDTSRGLPSVSMNAPAGTHGKPGPKFYENWPGSAFSDAYLERIAETEIDTLKLGHGPGTDFLGISFSALDIVGHAHGPDSSEVESILRLLDATLGALFERLDKSIGAGNYAVAFSADHGVAPIPENVERQGRDAGRANRDDLVERVEDVLKSYNPAGHSVAAFTDSDLYLAPGVYDKFRASSQSFDKVLTVIHNIPGVAAVYRGDELSKDAVADPLAKAAFLSYFPGRSGDVIVITKPYWFFDQPDKGGSWGSGTTHGSPYAYDEDVPIFLMGAAIRAGKYSNAVTPADIAPTLAALTGVNIAHTDGQTLSVAVKATPAH
ncbi:MAG: alkaline phosphatase family protein [Candidatus Acidiferrales bacterium]